LLLVDTSEGEGAYVVQGLPQRVVGLQEQGGIVLVLGQVKELFRHGLCYLVLCPDEMQPVLQLQHHKTLWGLPRLLSPHSGSGEHGFQLGRRWAFDDSQRPGEGDQEVQLTLVARGRLGHGAQHPQPCGEELERFGIRRARISTLLGLVPIGQGLSPEVRFRVVPGQQFGLRGRGLRKLGRQHLGNALMVLLPRTLEERLIRRLLDKGMLERVHGLRRYPPLVEHLGLHQLPQTSPQR